MGKKSVNKLSGKTILSFFMTLMLCASASSIGIINEMNVERLTMEQLISEKSAKARDVLSRFLYKTQTLAAFVMQNDGTIVNFNRIAATIVDDPAILNVLLAPDGVVTHVYPLKGNEAVIGLNFFSEGAGNKEAMLAKESQQLVLGGPFDSVQGGQILVGRYPVYLTDPESGDERFWGLVSITLKYPDALDAVGFHEFEIQGYTYEIWRINPDSDERQIITDGFNKYAKNMRYLEKTIPIQNAEWFFRILPLHAWYEYSVTWLLALLSLFISILVAFVVQSNGELRMLKSGLEDLSYVDPLTNIYNRRYFMDVALTHVERVARANGNAYVVILDLDHFKRVNDQYGHLVGDDVLRGVASRVREVIRPYDLFARFGGEEFILMIGDIDESSIRIAVERIRQSIIGEPIPSNELRLSVTASFGIAHVPSTNDFLESIALADKALYAAKAQGRDRVVFAGQDGFR